MLLKQYILSFIFLNSLSAWGQSITLQQCMEFAKVNHPNAKQVELINQQLIEQRKILDNTYLPQASIGGQATWQSQVTELPIKLPNVTIKPVSKDQYKLTLDVTQTVLDGGLSKAQKEAAEINSAVEQNKVQVELYSTNEQVVGLYFLTLIVKKQEDNLKLFIADLQQKKEKAEVGIANGIASKSAVLILEAKLIELFQQQDQIMAMQKSSIKSLNILTGREITLENITDVNQTEITTNEIVNRPELKLFDAQQQLIGANQKLIKAKNTPKLNAFATGGYAQPALNFLETGFSPYFLGGLQLRIPLSHYYNNNTASEIQQLKLNQQRIDIQKEAFLQAISLKTLAQNQEVEKLKITLESDKKLIAIRSKLREIADVQFNNGIISGSDYLSILNDENVSKQNFILHQIQIQQILTNIKITNGNN